MGGPPPALGRILADFDGAGRDRRIELLLAYSERYREPPPGVATRPYPPGHRVPGCESEAYVWALPRPDGTLTFHVAVDNPLGVSARALAVILGETASGAPLEQVLAIEEGIVAALFGPELSMGKGQGLTGMVAMVRGLARLHAPRP